MLKTLPVSNRVIKEAHKILLSDLPNIRAKNPGAFKDHQNFIGGGTRKISDARFIPPPPKETIEAMSELEKYLNSEGSSLPPLLDAALIHYQFETIHPFSDGNGRIGRMLIPMYLMEKGILEIPILYVSPAVENRKQEYADAMLYVSKTGNWTTWILFFLDVVEQSCANTIETIEKLLSLSERFKNSLIEINSSVKLQSLCEQLFDSPVINIPEAAKIMDTSYPTAASGIQKLVDLGILSGIVESSHPKQYICMEVIAATDPGL